VEFAVSRTSSIMQRLEGQREQSAGREGALPSLGRIERRKRKRGDCRDRHGPGIEGSLSEPTFAGSEEARDASTAHEARNDESWPISVTSSPVSSVLALLASYFPEAPSRTGRFFGSV
jgi:hypothetical protein